MNTVSTRLGSIPYLRIAIRLEAPQSIKNAPVSLSTRMQVLNRPPLPNASPLPRNSSRMHFILSGQHNARRHQRAAQVASHRLSLPQDEGPSQMRRRLTAAAAALSRGG